MYKKILAFLFIFVLMIDTVAYADTMYVSAQYCAVIDKTTSNVLYDKNMNKKASMASTTKIMTCLIACENNSFDDVVTVTSEMLDGTEGSLIYLNDGDRISLGDLILGAVLASGNDAANCIAFYIAGSIEGFADLMNEKAKAIGMNNTHFVTPSGLDNDEHYSTAYDMAILAKYALDNDFFAEICKMQIATITVNNEERTIYNHNKLLYMKDDCIGVKTGFTKKSGRCLVSAYDYKGSTIIIVTLNAPNDWNDHDKLLEFCKKKYRLYSEEKEIEIDIVGGENVKAKCIASYDIAYQKSLRYEIYYYPILYAPILENEKVGYMKIYSDDKLLRIVDIIILESVKVWQTTR